MRRWLGFLLATVLVGLPAFADIKSFNAAMEARDYTRATAAAVSAWPGLDKARDDFALIAREFSFAAMLAKDYATARKFAQAAVEASALLNEDQAMRAASAVLLALAVHNQMPNDTSRANLFKALAARSAFEAGDLISLLAVSTLTNFDFERARWKDAAASAALGVKLTGNSGQVSVSNFRFAQLSAAAGYLDKQAVESYRAIANEEKRLLTAIAGLNADQDVTELVDVYHELSAWKSTTLSHLIARRKFRNEKTEVEEIAAFRESDTFKAAQARITPPLPVGVCPATLRKNSPTPKFPSSALHKGMIGTVILKLDIDANGQVTRSESVASVPSKYFVDAANQGAQRMRFEPGEGAEAGCTLAQKGKVFTFVFSIAG